MVVNSRKIAIVGIGLLLIAVGVASFFITWALIENGQEIDIPKGVYVSDIDVSGYTVDQALQVVESKVDISTNQNVRLMWPGGSLSLDLAALDAEVNYPRLRSELLAVLPSGNYFQRMVQKKRLAEVNQRINITLNFDEEYFNDLLKSLESKIAKPAEDAHYQVDVLDKVKIITEKHGTKLDYESFFSELPVKLAKGEDPIHVPVTLIEPKMTAIDLSSWGIKELVTKYYTKFDPNNVNRVNNLKLAAKALDGTILKPGEEFSFNAWVGPRLKELGYKEAPILAKGEITEDVGGGVCQVSSTLYNLALLSDLKILERSPHSAPVSYVSPGRDAAVAFDYMDLRFLNAHKNALLITAEVVGDRLWCKVFGTALPYNVIVSTELLGEVPYEVKKGSPARAGRNGLKVATYTTKEGKKALVSKDYYLPLDEMTP